MSQIKSYKSFENENESKSLLRKTYISFDKIVLTSQWIRVKTDSRETVNG